MDSKDLYNSLVAKRDYSGSDADEYAQLLTTIYLNLGSDIFPLLEKAESENKKLSIKQEVLDSDVLVDELTADDIIIL